MRKGRSTLNKRQKEQARLQKQRDKVERRNQRKTAQPVVGEKDELRELETHGEAQLAMFGIGQASADLAIPVTAKLDNIDE